MLVYFALGDAFKRWHIIISGYKSLFDLQNVSHGWETIILVNYKNLKKVSWLTLPYYLSKMYYAIILNHICMDQDSLCIHFDQIKL